MYNLAREETVTILQLATAVSGIVGDTDILHTEGRAGDFRGAEVSSRRAFRELGWSASTGLEEGLSRYFGWLTESDEITADPDPVG